RPPRVRHATLRAQAATRPAIAAAAKNTRDATGGALRAFPPLRLPPLFHLHAASLEPPANAGSSPLSVREPPLHAGVPPAVLGSRPLSAQKVRLLTVDAPL